MPNNFTITFWGVRGSRPVPGTQTVEYGGNTPCVELSLGDRLIILDAGTGICNLGQSLDLRKTSIYGDILITHAHWDHIQGFPFFTPAFQKGNQFCLYGEGKENITFAALMKRLMMYPHFPVPMEKMGAELRFIEIDPGDYLDLGAGIVVKTAPNNHPDGGLSYRIEYEGRSCCYVTDTEQGTGIDLGLLELCSQADVIIFDAHFTEAEYLGLNGDGGHQGWGHSTWQEGIKLCRAAMAKELILFHHSPFRNDLDLAGIEQEARQQYQQCRAAREGMVIEL